MRRGNRASFRSSVGRLTTNYRSPRGGESNNDLGTTAAPFAVDPWIAEFEQGAGQTGRNFTILQFYVTYLPFEWDSNWRQSRYGLPVLP